MNLRNWKQVYKNMTFTKPRIAVWCIVLLVCVGFSALVLSAPEKVQREYNKVDCQEQDYAPYFLDPGSTLVQKFKAQGQSTGEVSHLYLNMFRQEEATGSLSVRILREKNEEQLEEITCDFEKIPVCINLERTAAEALSISQTRDSLRPSQNEMDPALVSPVMLGDGWFLLKSGEYYRVEITNHSESHPICLLGDPDVQSGTLMVDGEEKEGFLNLSWMRKSLYMPSRMLLLMVLLTDATVLLGLALVLFTNTKTHALYLVLAIGFGIVTLFDLTPLYGFDMRFQFDSAYVLSNQLMGRGGYQWVPEEGNPNGGTAYYSRRYCDDYSQYQMYKTDEVSANYTDMKAGIRNLRASSEEQKEIWVTADRGFISEQLYLYLPQAIGFTIARLLGLGMYPMLQMARILAYAVFALVVYFTIRKVPFGKGVFLVSALLPTVMVQTVSLTRDAMIICMGFYITATAIQMAYVEQKPKKSDWIKLAVVSALLAPCKMIYLPLSCLFLLVLYRHYIMPAGEKAKKRIQKIILWGIAGVAVFILLNFYRIWGILFSESVSVYNTESYSIGYMLSHPVQMLTVLANTVRTQFGSYFVNAVQLFDIDLGCSDGITIAVFALLALSNCHTDEEKGILRKEERIYMLLVASGVFLLTALASLRWTPMGSDVIVGLQGRYLTPVLPLICIAFYGSHYIRVSADAEKIVLGGCCIFPAISLMNMYLWAVSL